MKLSPLCKIVVKFVVHDVQCMPQTSWVSDIRTASLLCNCVCEYMGMTNTRAVYICMNTHGTVNMGVVDTSDARYISRTV